MVITKRKYKELIARIERLEANSTANTWSWGKVDLAWLARVVDEMNAKIKKLPAAADRAESE